MRLEFDHARLEVELAQQAEVIRPRSLGPGFSEHRGPAPLRRHWCERTAAEIGLVVTNRAIPRSRRNSIVGR